MIRGRPTVSCMRAASLALNIDSSLSDAMGKRMRSQPECEGSVGVPEILLLAEHHFQRLWEVQRPSPFLGTFVNLQELKGNCMVTLAKMCPAEL